MLSIPVTSLTGHFRHCRCLLSDRSFPVLSLFKRPLVTRPQTGLWHCTGYGEEWTVHRLVLDHITLNNRTIADR